MVLGIRPLAALLILLAAANVPAERQHFERQTMGTVGSILIDVPDSAGVSAERALDEFTRIDALLSNWIPTSEVARVNREAIAGTTVNLELNVVLSEAVRIGAASDGAFDVTVEPLVRLWGFLGGKPAVPESEAIEELLPRIGLEQLDYDPAAMRLRFRRPEIRIDLGGIAKGYAVDRAFLQLQADEVASALIDLSGNMRAIGHPEGREHWSVGVRDPLDLVPYFLKLQLDGEAIATSGNYEQFVAQDGKRYGHILNPRTGWPVDDLLQATVLAPTALEADAWATAMMVLGWDAAQAVAARHPELECILVRLVESDRCEVAISEGLGERVQPVEAAAARFEVRPLQGADLGH